MLIYAEYLFLENFITGIIILWFTGKICGIKAGKIPMLLGGGMCGFFSFIILAGDMGFFLSTFLKILFSAAVILVVFGSMPHREIPDFNQIRPWFRKQIRILICFYIISFLMGGITIAIIYLTGIKGISGNGYVYMEGASYLKVAIGVLVSWGVLNIFTGFTKDRIREERLKRRVLLKIGEQEFKLKAFADTGNHLRDPLSGKPVFVISRRAAAEVLERIPKAEGERRFCAIPFRSAGTVKGMMEGFRADSLAVYEGREEIHFEPAIFAIYEGEFAERKSGEQYEILLNNEILEGGLI